MAKTGLPRILAVAGNVYLEILRDRLLYLVALFTLLMVAAAVLLPPIAAGTEHKIFLDLGLAAIHWLSGLVALLVGSGLINREVDKRTILVVLTKPVSRAEWVVGKHLGLAMVLVLLVGALGLVLLLLLILQGITFALSSLLWAIGFTALEAILLAAIALFFGSFTSSLLAMLMGLAVYLMGHLSQHLVNLARLSQDPGLTRISNFLYLVLPDLERLNLRNLAVYGPEVMPQGSVLISHGLYALAYTAMLLSLTSLIIYRRQF
ncbi:MAG: ABC transporter permease [Nodosilinea sp. LVE1205-7]|jgi:ABC-type transport system involved in multi-copper enzyme maturation permease subunit